MDQISDGSLSHEPKSDEDDGDSRRRLSIDCLVDAGHWQSLGEVEPLLDRLADAVSRYSELPAARCIAVLALSDDAGVRRLNSQYRGIDKPTNVLSFPAPEPAASPAGVVALGDVILAEETVLKEAREQAIPPRDHFAHLVVHGVLHLLGFDHICDTEAERMEETEVAVLADLGIANPYDEPELEEAFGRSRTI